MGALLPWCFHVLVATVVYKHIVSLISERSILQHDFILAKMQVKFFLAAISYNLLDLSNTTLTFLMLLT